MDRGMHILLLGQAMLVYVWLGGRVQEWEVGLYTSPQPGDSLTHEAKDLAI